MAKRLPALFHRSATGHLSVSSINLMLELIGYYTLSACVTGKLSAPASKALSARVVYRAE